MKRKLFLLTFIFTAAVAQATPLSVSFEEMIARSKSIVTGTYLGEFVPGKTFHIEVDSVVKGSPRAGIIAVNKAKGIPRVLPGTKVMAFINAQDQWEWMGLSSDFSHGIISLSGIYDLNSYTVYPDAISMTQLDEFKNTGHFTGVIEGGLRFWSFDKKDYEESSTYFAITYTYYNSDSVPTRYLAGGLNTGLFPSVPSIYFAGSTVVLTYDENPDRPLQLIGTMDSLKGNGVDYVANFEVSQPMNLSLAQYNQYVINDRFGPLCYDLAILVNSRPGEAVVGNSALPLVFGEDQGDIGYLVFGDRRIECTQFSVPTDDQRGIMKFGTWSQPEVEIELDEVSPLVDNDAVRAMHGSRFINLLRVTQLTGQLYVWENGVRVSRGNCVLMMEQTRFTENPGWNNN